AASLMIVVPNGVQMFCWIATLWGGKPRLTLPLLWVVGFIAVFVIGGLTGVMLASVQVDLQAHDTFFVVAHLHYVLIGGAAFPMGVGVLVFILNVLWSRKRGKPGGNNPWAAGTLEWATTSPPPRYNFLYPPTVQGRDAVWENAPDAPVVTGLATDKRQVLVT